MFNFFKKSKEAEKSTPVVNEPKITEVVEKPEPTTKLLYAHPMVYYLNTQSEISKRIHYSLKILRASSDSEKINLNRSTRHRWKDQDKLHILPDTELTEAEFWFAYIKVDVEGILKEDYIKAAIAKNSIKVIDKAIADIGQRIDHFDNESSFISRINAEIKDVDSGLYKSNKIVSTKVNQPLLTPQKGVPGLGQTAESTNTEVIPHDVEATEGEFNHTTSENSDSLHRPHMEPSSPPQAECEETVSKALNNVWVFEGKEYSVTSKREHILRALSYFKGWTTAKQLSVLTHESEAYICTALFRLMNKGLPILSYTSSGTRYWALKKEQKENASTKGYDDASGYSPAENYDNKSELLVDALRTYNDIKGRPPTISDISDQLKWNIIYVKNELKRLSLCGKVKYEKIFINGKKLKVWTAFDDKTLHSS